ncbi:MAG: glycine dehydrogenase, partial [Alphaproteobacteria bacterium]|nr:glycine dehydrogenase [Alphaproteobacteria bacterium]
FFNEFTLRLPVPAAPLVEDLAHEGIFPGVPASRLWPGIEALDNLLITAVTEANDETDADALVGALARALS